MRSFSKSASSCSSTDDDAELRRGPWTGEEDTLLIHYISSHGEGRWNSLAKLSGLKRTGKSCRLRWLNYLKPDVKRGNLAPEEQLLILELHSKWGNSWSKIAKHLPGRTDNEIKNYWRTKVQKQARHLKIDSNSTEFQELIRCVWMPRLLQKIQGSSAALWDSSSLHNSAETQSLMSNSSVATQAPLCPSEASHHLDYHYQMYPTMENSSSPSISSSDSTNISQAAPPISEHSDNIPTHDMNHSHYYNQSQNGCYNVVDNASYAMETFNLASYTVMGGCKLDPAACDFYSTENNWVGDELAYGLWNVDEL